MHQVEQRCAVCGVNLDPKIYGLDVMGEGDDSELEVVALIRLCERCWIAWQWYKSKLN